MILLASPWGAPAEPSPAVAPHQQRRLRAAGKPSDELGAGSQRLRLLAAVVLPPIGTILIVLSYHHAAGLAEPDQAQFALFWAGFLGGILPLVALACGPCDDPTRACALAGIGLFGMVPTLLRQPWPLGNDAFCHLRQSLETFLRGDVGHPSPLLPVTQHFPGLHQSVNAFAWLTGLSLRETGMIVILLAHVLSVLAIYQLVRAVGGPPRGAAVGAVVYTLNPSWAYFDTAVSYESLALPMLLWFLAATVAASRAQERPPLRYIATIVLCAAALPLVHHLTTIVLCLIVALLIVANRVYRVRSAAAGDSRLSMVQQVSPAPRPPQPSRRVAAMTNGNSEPHCSAVTFVHITPDQEGTELVRWGAKALRGVAGLVHRVRSAATGDSVAQREHLSPLLLAASCLLVSIAFWWSDKWHWILDYLSPAIASGLTQLSELLGVTRQAAAEPSGERAAFGGAENPIYEIVSGLLFPAVVLVLFLASAAVLWHNRRRVGSAPWAFAVPAVMYFLYMPMVMTKGGAEGAHRSWAFSFIGIAVLCGLAWSFGPAYGDVLAASRRPVVNMAGRYVERFDRPGVKVGVVGVVLTVMMLGGAALGNNVATRFPGSPHVGDDARSVSLEGAAVTAWIAAHTPIDTPVLADRYVSQQLGSIGRMATLSPSASFPVWDLYMSQGPVAPDVIKQVLDSHIRYFVVDARMATTRPWMDGWFTADEPGAGGRALYPRIAIDRFNCLPWLRATYAAGPLTVYEVDAEVLRRTMAGSCESPGG